MLTLADRMYDAYVTAGPPDPPEIPLPGDPHYPTCSDCGCWLKRDWDPALDQYGELEERCNGFHNGDETAPNCGGVRPHEAHTFVTHAWVVHHRICKHCGHDNVEVDA